MSPSRAKSSVAQKAVAREGEVCYNFLIASAETAVAGEAVRHRRPFILRPSHPCRMKNEKFDAIKVSDVLI